jgi:hypothetical protein
VNRTKIDFLVEKARMITDTYLHLVESMISDQESKPFHVKCTISPLLIQAYTTAKQYNRDMPIEVTATETYMRCAQAYYTGANITEPYSKKFVKSAWLLEGTLRVETRLIKVLEQLEDAILGDKARFYVK